jgi:hypothetical protein
VTEARAPADTSWLTWHARRPPRGRRPPFTALCLALGLLVCALGWQASAARADALTAVVARACDAYAGLDLADLAAACRAVGYQQVMPEDLGR